MRLPPGFRFHPTDEELIVYYLKRKIMGKKLMFDAVTEINIYKYAPSDLPEKCLLGSRDLEWYFFCPREKKYACGARLNRATENGYWKMTGMSKPVNYNQRPVGTRQTLIFHSGHAPNGVRTDWVMHEYKLKDQSLLDVVQDAYVLCKIFQKSGPGPKNGAQYGAPFNEEEWSDMEDFTCQIFSNSAPPSNNINDSNAVSLSVPGDSLANFIPTTNLCMDGAQNIDMDLSIKEIGVESSAADPNGLPNYVSPAITRSSAAMCMSTPRNSYISSPKSGLAVSLVNDMPGYPSNSDDDILALMNLFTEDTNMPPVENNITQFETNGHLPCLDENNIYNDLADLNWIELRDTQFNLSTAQDAAYSSNQVVMFDDAPYFELNDLSTPLRCHSETGELGAPGTICADETFGTSVGMDDTYSEVANTCFMETLSGWNDRAYFEGANKCFVETLSGWNDHSALLDGSHLAGNNLEELGKDNLIGDSGAHGSRAATSNEVPVLIAEPENGSIAEQMKRKGEPQSNFQLLLEYLFNHMIRAEQLICSIPHYSSSIHFKAEVTLKVGECTKDALLLYMEESAFILISRGNQPIGDVIIKRSTVAICFLFGCSWLKFGSCHILCCHASSIRMLHFLSFLVFYFIICMLYDHILVILLNKLIANHQAASLPMVFKFSVFFITIYIFKIASPHSLVFING